MTVKGYLDTWLDAKLGKDRKRLPDLPDMAEAGMGLTAALAF